MLYFYYRLLRVIIARYKTVMGDKRGNAAEWKVKEKLKFLKQDSLIISYKKHKKHSEKDEQGIDFTVITRRGVAMPLQVKSSEYNVERHKQKYPNIPVVNGYDGKLRAKILKAIKDYEAMYFAK